MKTLGKCLACSASLMVMASLSPAQTSSQGTSQQSGPGTGSQQQSSTSQPSSRQSSAGQMPSSQQQQQLQQKFMQARNLLGKEAKTAQGQSLGKVHDITFQGQTGEIFAILDLGNNRYTPVPWQALNVTTTQGAEPQIAVNTTREKLQSGPTLSGQQWQTDLSRPGFTQQIYSHYNLQPPTGMGASGAAPSGEIRGGSDQHHQQQHQQQQRQQTNPGSPQQQPGASQPPYSSDQEPSRSPRQPF